MTTTPRSSCAAHTSTPPAAVASRPTCSRRGRQDGRSHASPSRFPWRMPLSVDPSNDLVACRVLVVVCFGGRLGRRRVAVSCGVVGRWGQRRRGGRGAPPGGFFFPFLAPPGGG